MNLEPHGWLDIFITPTFGERIEIPASFLTDAIRDLVDKLIALRKGADDVEITIQTEPGEYRFWIKKQSASRVQFEVYEMSDNFSSEAVHEGRRLMSEEVTRVRLYKLMYRELKKMKDLGLDEYKKRWSGDFPQSGFTQIERYVQN
ncbi:hypothetical protein MH215_18940 [Paenibacillus sp. ACRSA]|uniref:hypothetical protein n=1 Tax=Paenibacillus sp. ACRSA TaxID=2918211 RepID=UPI001EF6E78C|nr:hypothetical protein [Paenibacillus sp. ACRSA]MCG7379094.1 hypothetical protein [Paenibacillus sp. ACRSA]